MKFVPNAVSMRLGRQILLAKKNSPAIMFGAGITLAVTSTVMACKATLRLDEPVTRLEKRRANGEELVNAKRDDYNLTDFDREMRIARIQFARDVAKLYAPAAGVGLLALGLLTGSHVTLTKRNVALTAAYTLLDRGFNEYRERVRNELGEDKDKEFRYGVQAKEIVEEGEHGHEVKTVKRNDVHGKSIYARLFDQGNPNWSPNDNDNRMFIQVQQSWLNDLLNARGHVLLNDAYDALGMERSPAGCVVGWVKRNKQGVGDGYIDFGLSKNTEQVHDFMRGDEKSILLDFNVDGMVYKLI
jgi:hypothetical protein